jgi:hypothetical protein
MNIGSQTMTHHREACRTLPEILDDYLPEIQRTWSIYRDLAAPILIRVVRL